MAPTMAQMVDMEAFVVDIVPDDENVLLFTEQQGKTLSNLITRALFADDNVANIKFESAGLDRGRYRMVCKDEVSRDWATEIVSKIGSDWKGKPIKTVQSGSPARLVRATVNLSVPTLDTNDFFNIIGAQNPDIETKNWKLYSKTKVTNGKQQWIIGVDEVAIPALRAVNCRPYCGMGRVKIFLPNNQYQIKWRTRKLPTIQDHIVNLKLKK